MKKAIWIKKTKPTMNRDSGIWIYIVTHLCPSDLKTAASKQLCEGHTRLEKVHRSGRKLASQNIKVGRSFKLLHEIFIYLFVYLFIYLFIYIFFQSSLYRIALSLLQILLFQGALFTLKYKVNNNKTIWSCKKKTIWRQNNYTSNKTWSEIEIVKKIITNTLKMK